MIDWPTFDLILLGLVMLGYVRHGSGPATRFHDPVSLGLAGALGAESAAVPAIAEAAVIPEIAGAAALPALAGAGEVAGGLAGADLFGSAGAAGSLAGDLGAGGIFGGAAPALDTAGALGGGADLAAETAAPTTANAALSPAASVVTDAAGGGTPGATSAATPLSSAASTGVSPTGTGTSLGADAGAGFSGGGGGTASSSGVGGWLGNNWDKVAKAGISGLGLLMAQNQGNQPLPAEASLQNAAESAQTTAQTLQGYQITGTLPPGMKQIVDMNNASAKAAIKSQYAGLGYGGSTAEKQAIQQVDQASTAQIAQLANQLAAQGMSFAQLSASEFNNLLQAQMAHETAFQNSLAKFASGLAGAIS
jgi:hypothetical protein